MNLRRLGALAAAALLVPFALTACSPAQADDDGRLQVLASFYPLQFVAEQVGGDLVSVQNLTPPAADPHDLELSLARARELGLADVVLFLSGFQPAVDDAIEQRAPRNVVDAADHVTLLSASVTGTDCVDHDHSHDHAADEECDDAHAGSDCDDAAHSHSHSADECDDPSHDHSSDDHSSDETGSTTGGEYDAHATDSGHSHSHDMGGYDPHFWLDPMKLAELAAPVADAFAKADPAGAATFAANAADLVERLTALDAEFAEALAPFQGATLITNHTAFGYLAHRYGLGQVGITGLDHNIEPSPARMREIGQIARDNNVGTLFYETLVSPRVVQTLASDLGLDVRVLNTLEGLSDQEIAAGEDYITVMRRNLQALTEGLQTR